MPEETEDTTSETTTEAKPTITIAEKQGGSNATEESKPTITIAEKDGGK
jgi:hypothetical protein